MNDVQTPAISKTTRALLLVMQRNELTESLVYGGIADRMKTGHNREVLIRCSSEELSHAEMWRKYTGVEVRADKFKAWFFVTAARLIGFSFVLKLMENGESVTSAIYATQLPEIPEAKAISEEEDQHENALIELLDEERLQYVGSMVLGLSDALVELTGTLAGLTLALRNTKLVALSGLVTGISAALSMASSAYLSSRADGKADAFKSCVYTGCVYLATVMFLVAPYLLFPKSMAFSALAVMLLVVLLIIAGFTWYISVAKNVSFKRRFTEMAGLSFGVAAISFVIGFIVSRWLGIDVG